MRNPTSKVNAFICIFVTLLLSLSSSVHETPNRHVLPPHSGIHFDTSISVGIDSSKPEKYYKPSGYPVAPEDVLLNIRKCSGFGMRFHPLLKKKRKHNGFDFPAKTGTPIVSTLFGKVKRVGYTHSKGKYVELISGDGVYITENFHCDRILVKDGDPVMPGQRIATVGNTGLSTGSHLHYGIVINGGKVHVNPINYILKSNWQTL